MTPARSAVGEALRDIRRLHGLSQQAVADNSGGALSRFTVAALECGRKKDISIGEVVTFAHALGVSPEGLAEELVRAVVRRG